MTHQDECPAINDLTALLIEHGLAAMASALATLMNHAMRIEREQVLQTESHQQTADRQGYANGYKPKTLKTRVGRVDLRIPQTRDYRDENGWPFYPRSLERGVHSERAMSVRPPQPVLTSPIASGVDVVHPESKEACDGSAERSTEAGGVAAAAATL